MNCFSSSFNAFALTLKGDHGAIEIETPRDRNGSFEPVFVP